MFLSLLTIHWLIYPLVYIASETLATVIHSTLPSETSLYEISPEIVDTLDIDSILPYLLKYHILTRDQMETLLLPVLTRKYKVELLISWLPQIGPDFLDVFIDCLSDSAEGYVNHQHFRLSSQLRAKKIEDEKELDEREDEVSELLSHDSSQQSMGK